jgi:hypothetical protein
VSHRAAIYMLRVRRRYAGGDHHLFGDWDDQGGGWFGDVVLSSLRGLNATDRNGEVRTVYEADLPNLNQNEVGVSVRGGRGGVTSVLEKPGEAPFARTPAHLEHMRSGVVFKLPKGASQGWVAVHSPHGHGAKGVIERHLAVRCSVGGCTMELTPVIPMNALRAAVEQDLVEKVTLIKHQPGSSDEFGDSSKWGEEVDRLELDVFAKRSKKLGGGPLVNFLENPSPANRRAVVELAGLTFDEVAVRVQLEDGLIRTYWIDRPERGFPVSVDLGGLKDYDELGPSGADIAAGLKSALTTVTQQS